MQEINNAAEAGPSSGRKTGSSNPKPKPKAAPKPTTQQKASAHPTAAAATAAPSARSAPQPAPNATPTKAAPKKMGLFSNKVLSLTGEHLNQEQPQQRSDSDSDVILSDRADLKALEDVLKSGRKAEASNSHARSESDLNVSLARRDSQKKLTERIAQKVRKFATQDPGTFGSSPGDKRTRVSDSRAAAERSTHGSQQPKGKGKSRAPAPSLVLPSCQQESTRCTGANAQANTARSTALATTAAALAGADVAGAGAAREASPELVVTAMPRRPEAPKQGTTTAATGTAMNATIVTGQGNQLHDLTGFVEPMTAPAEPPMYTVPPKGGRFNKRQRCKNLNNLADGNGDLHSYENAVQSGEHVQAMDGSSPGEHQQSQQPQRSSLLPDGICPVFLSYVPMPTCLLVWLVICLYVSFAGNLFVYGSSILA